MTIFKNPVFGEIRTSIDEKQNIWLVGKDITTILGYKDPSRALFDHVDEEDKTTLLIQQSGSNYKTKTTLVNESGLYSLIFSSKLPLAKQFKHWVTAEVLPSIRMNGGYMQVRPDDTEEDLLHRAYNVVQKQFDAINYKNKVLSEKAQHLEDVLMCKQCYTMTQVAKELNMTVHDLTAKLYDRGIIYDQSGQHMLYADYARQGLAKTRTARKIMEDGSIRVFPPYLVWTEKGRMFIHNIIKMELSRVSPKMALAFSQPSLFSKDREELTRN